MRTITNFNFSTQSNSLSIEEVLKELKDSYLSTNYPQEEEFIFSSFYTLIIWYQKWKWYYLKLRDFERNQIKNWFEISSTSKVNILNRDTYQSLKEEWNWKEKFTSISDNFNSEYLSFN